MITQLHFIATQGTTFNELQRWPRAVGKLAGDATLGPGQFRFFDPTRALCFGTPLWKSTSTQLLEAGFHLLLTVITARSLISLG
jgi:hypothetical protein